MMSVLHRIFVSKHKRKKIYTKRKTTYKKFLGLKNITRVLYTSLSLPHRVGTVKKLPKRRTVSVLTAKRRLQIKFPALKLLPLQTRRREVVSACSDILNFTSIKNDGLLQKSPEKKFQAFIPQVIWDKMAPEEKRAHINKKKALASGAYTRPAQSKYGFSNKGQRPMFGKMSFKRRRHYLKNLIKFANVVPAAAALAPYSKNKISEIFINQVKSAILGGKNARIRSNNFKNLTYVSVLPSRVRGLIL